MQNLSYSSALPTDRGARVAATIAALTNCAANFAVVHRIALDDADEDVATGCLEYLAGYLRTLPDGLKQARHIAAELIVSQLPAPQSAHSINPAAPSDGLPSDVEPLDAEPSDTGMGGVCYV